MRHKANWKSIVISICIIGILLFLSIGSCSKDALLVQKAVLMPEPDEALSGGTTTVFDQTINAFALPAPTLSGDDELLFFTGNSFFNQNWVIAPSSTTARDGLGPMLNAKSCSSCHLKDGRGQPPATIGELSNGFIIRLSVPGNGPHGEPLPEPTYGTQFQDNAIEGVISEGLFQVTYTEILGKFDDGETYALRKPATIFTLLNYGALAPGTLVSGRVAPQMIGLGLLEAIPEATILSHADEHDTNHDGISGKANEVWDIIHNKTALGRFGWKANQPSLLQQDVAAFNGDIGITSSYMPNQNIEASQAIYKNLPSGGSPEISNDNLEKIHLYTETLAVPARRNTDDVNVLEGKKLFFDAGCNSCHMDRMVTGNESAFTILNNQTIHPYTDLLLHDMGEGLADNRPDFLATGSEWRTPPLWGIGLFMTVNKHTYYLHDGRARNISEAILWHGGEAQKAKDSYIHMSKQQRENLLLFLNSL